MREQKRYNVAVYCRLSKDDDIRSGESSSITSQKEMLEKYCNDKGWHIHDYYIDDGYTGTNFNRPNFKRMIDDIEDGKINCVITKDLSRLGRNYILAGQYTEMYFPSKNVRYIAINDGVDTLHNNNDIAPFKNILNEFYSRDISKKVKSALRAKKESGKFVSAFAPYGYQKDPYNKNKLIVEETAAKVVRRIFELARGGLGAVKISQMLNTEGIPTPHHHHRKIVYGIEPQPARWNHGAVVTILRSRYYLGDTVQGVVECEKFRRIPAKRKPQEEWIITENTHEPLVDRETWEFVQKQLNSRIHPIKSKEVHLFAGLLRCEDCGSALGYSASHKIPHYMCGQYRRLGRTVCASHYIRQDVLKQVVLSDIRKYSKLAKNKADELTTQLQAQNGTKEENQVKILQAELKRLEGRNIELKGIIKRLYEDNVTGKISDERFNEFMEEYETEQSSVKSKIEEIQQTIKSIEENKKDTTAWIALIRNYSTIKELDRDVLTELVDKITIGEAKNVNGEKVRDVTIYYRFVGAVA